MVVIVIDGGHSNGDNNDGEFCSIMLSPHPVNICMDVGFHSTLTI